MCDLIGSSNEKFALLLVYKKVKNTRKRYRIKSRKWHEKEKGQIYDQE